jgi:hypothetical protein
MRWILLSTLLAAPCLGGEPPFSHIRRRPSISPYIRMDEEFFMPYQMEVRPQMDRRTETDARSEQRPERMTRPTMPHTEGIRPTGHPTYFMIFDFRPS